MQIDTLIVFVLTGFSFVFGADPNSCTPLSSQKNTSQILSDLRVEMQNANISVYVIFADDEHGSEYTQPFDKRRNWITNFRGSAGTAVVSMDSAALWTDSRYFTQAELELDCANWLLMRSGLAGVPSIYQWIASEANKSALDPGTTTVFTSASWWSSANNVLQGVNKQLKDVEDLVGKIWPANERPAALTNPIVPHNVTYAGETVDGKLNRTKAELLRGPASAVVLSALDEIAWLFNLRGSDIPYNPFFKAYAIVYFDSETYQPELFVNLTQLSVADRPAGVIVSEYSEFWERLTQVANNSSIEKIWASPRVSQAIINRIPDAKLLKPQENSPVQRVKAKKNSVERQGMRNCQVRDAVARMKHLGWLEQQLNNGNFVNETASSAKLLEFQNEQNLFQFPSFSTISAVGENAAIVHYAPQVETAKTLTKNEVYLLDAGGQYLDCTTDITRTHHFGTAKALEKRAYTRVLQGVLDLADAVFPDRMLGRSLDHLGRMSLYRDGMTFGHGVGHGIGHFLSVHEGPQRIANGYSQYEEGLTEGVFLSDEPGFYQPNDFGIRIENDIEVVLTNKSADGLTQYLRFDTITLVPYERSLIDISLLTKAQIAAINTYHAKVVQVLTPLLIGDTAALAALNSRTGLLSQETTTVAPISSSSTTPATSSSSSPTTPATSSSSSSATPTSSSSSSSSSTTPSRSSSSSSTTPTTRSSSSSTTTRMSSSSSSPTTPAPGSSSSSTTPGPGSSSSSSTIPTDTTTPSNATWNTGGLSILITLLFILSQLRMNSNSAS